MARLGRAQPFRQHLAPHLPPAAGSGASAAAGGGELTAAGRKNASAAGTAAGSGRLTAAGAKAAHGSSSITGAGAAVSAGRKNASASASVSGAGLLGSSGGAAGSSAAAGTGVLSASGRRSASGASRIGGAGLQMSAGTRHAAAAAALSGTGTPKAAGRKTASAAGTLSGTGVLTAPLVLASTSAIAGTGTLKASGHRAASGSSRIAGGTSAASAGREVPQVVNQWATTFAQPGAFQSMPPALQSTVLALDSGTSVGGGTGVPTAGNWLFCITGWNQKGLPSVTVADSDDIHSFWRPGDVTTSTWAVSPSSGNTRTSVWYTPNLARSPADVYAAPDGAMAGRACLVIEVAGLGPWDQVTGIYPHYAAAATSLNLALAAASGPAFLLAAVCGDSSAVSQAFAPAGWTALHTVTASNGTDHTCDAVLTSACTTTSGSVSVNATAGSATDLSGVIIGVLQGAPSPVPAGANPAWPGRVIWEAAFGSGFQTPPDQRTWTVLNDSAWTPGAGIKRFWSLGDNTGVGYQLGQLQSGTGTDQLDNFDGALSPSNTASPYYPDVDTGTPVRMRAAIGTVKGVTQDRWYVIERNAMEWPEQRNEAFRGFVPLTITDIWSAASGNCSTPYRGEVEQDSPYAWWPADDQPGVGGVKPTFLRNAAPGNTNNLNILLSPNGAYSAYAGDTSMSGSSFNNPANAVYSVAALAGWMYGDPQASPSSYATGNPVTAQPGAYAWQQTGAQCGNPGATGYNAGGYGWYLACNDTGFPALASGVTAESWHNVANFYTDAGVGSAELGQPPAILTMWEMATASGPTAILYLDTAGHLQLTTYSGGSGTTTAIWTSSDLRIGAWFHVAVVFNSTTSVTVYLNGGLTATVTATVPAMTSAWSWMIYGADMGTGGGGTTAGIEHLSNTACSHMVIYPSALPAWRIWSHYNAAITGFGAIPAPSNIAVTASTGKPWPDGLYYSPVSYFAAPNAFCAVVTANLGSWTSGPSAETSTTLPTATGQSGFWTSWNGLAPKFTLYSSQAAQAEKLAGTTTIEDGAGSPNAFGSGASPPTAPSAFGDAVNQRIERALAYGGLTYPGRSVDLAGNLVQAALDIGGQSCGANVQNIVNSDDGWLFVDACGNLCYRARAHLAADGVVWYLGMDVLAGQYPFWPDIAYSTDPVRVQNNILATQYSPDGATLPLTVPQDAAGVTASQLRYGPRPGPYTSYLQSASEIQAQVNWRFAQFGTTSRRLKVLTIDAAKHPAAWPLFLGGNPCDIVSVYDAPVAAPASTSTFRIATISRAMSFGANGLPTQAKVTLTCDFRPSDYWA